MVNARAVVPSASAEGRAVSPSKKRVEAEQVDSARNLVELSWLPDGARILVGKRWLWSEAGNEFTFTPFLGLSRNAAEREIGTASIIFAPSAARVMLVKGQNIEIRHLSGVLEKTVPIPYWIDLDGFESSDLFQVAFWLSEQLIFVQQYNIRNPVVQRCGQFDLRAGKWTKPPRQCLVGEFSYLGRVDAGPRNWLAVHSEAEGIVAIEFYRYSLEKSRPAMRAILADADQFTIHFAPDGSRVELVTPCHLCRPGEDESVVCNKLDQEEAAFSCWPATRATNLYSLPLNDGPIELRRFDLPPGAVLDPKHNRFAWTHGNEICVESIVDRRVRCAPLPP